MKLIFAMFAIVSIVASSPPKNVQQIQDNTDYIQAKRDLSLSYAATDIGSKEGTRVKTITVIKNVIGKKEKPLKIDPNLHKEDNWGSHFRDNFDAYGAIPDVPDIDELFDFVNKKEDKNLKPAVEEENENKKKSDETKSEEDSNNVQTTMLPAPVEEAVNEEKVEKILGDVELVQPENKKDKTKSQSLHLGKYRIKEFVREDFVADISNAPTHINKNEKYYQSPSDPYFYLQPNPLYPTNDNSFSDILPYQSHQSQKSKGSISVSTTSGKKFDVPVNNATDSSPYIAPSYRKTQTPLNGQQATSSQRPYIAPNLRKSYEVQPNPQEIQPNVRTIRFGASKPNSPRSRGLRY